MSPEAQEISDKLSLCGSHDRTRAMVLALISAWPDRSLLAELLRENSKRQSARDYMSEEDAQKFDALPDLVAVYRGCARYRLRGLSWTTDRTRLLALGAAILASTAFIGEPPLRVIDGDTVARGSIVYRLVGFDAPETGDRARCAAEADLGRRCACARSCSAAPICSPSLAHAGLTPKAPLPATMAGVARS